MHNEKKLVANYLAHSEAVREVEFTHDGRHFISGAYDKRINYWDTETGKIVTSLKIKYFPYCLRFNPEYSK